MNGLPSIDGNRIRDSLDKAERISVVFQDWQAVRHPVFVWRNQIPDTLVFTQVGIAVATRNDDGAGSCPWPSRYDEFYKNCEFH